MEALFTVSQMPLSNELHAGGDSHASLALEQTAVMFPVEGWTKRAVADGTRRRRKRGRRETDVWAAMLEKVGRKQVAGVERERDDL